MPSNTVKVDQALSTMKKVEEYILAGMDTTVDVAVDFVESDSSETQKIEELKEGMLQYINMQRDLNQFIEAVEAVKSQTIEDMEDVESILRNKLQEISSGNDDAQLQRHEKYRDMLQRITDLQHQDDDDDDDVEDALTTVMESQSASNEDVEFTQEEISTKCPFTKMEMIHPMRNKLCKHIYDKEAVEQMIKNRGRKARCPVVGCPNTTPLSMANMEEHIELKRFIDKKRRQAAKKGKRT